MANAKKQYWLLKTEPETFSFSELMKTGKTNWNDVRNYQARNFLKQVKKGDLALIYHSGDEKAVVGVAICVREHYRDFNPKEDKETDDWVQVDLKPVRALSMPVTLKEIKASQELSKMMLVKQSRLSVMPVEKAHFDFIMSGQD